MVNITSIFFKHTNYTLIFSYLGFERKSVIVKSIRDGRYKIYLVESVKNLEGVTLDYRRKTLQRKIAFEKLAPMAKGLSGLGAVAIRSDNKIMVMAGDESYTGDGIRRNLRKDPSLANPGATISDMVARGGANLDWQHFSGAIYSYDIPSDTWEEWDIALKERAYHESFVYRGKIYILGGKRLAKDEKTEYLRSSIEVLDLQDGTVMVDRTNPHQAVNFGTVVYGENLITLGGTVREEFEVKKVYTDKVHLYNFPSGLWYELKSLPEPMEANTVLVNKTIYFIGGSKNNSSKRIASYDIATGNFIQRAELFDKMERPGLAASGNKIYIFNNGRLSTYDTVSETLKEYLIDCPVIDAELLEHRGFLYIVGGLSDDGFTRTPSRRFIRIDIKKMDSTEVHRQKSFSG